VRAAAKQMEMQVIHGLAAVCAGIDNDAIAFAEAFVAGNLSSRLEKMAEEIAMLSTRVIERGNVFAGNDEDMDGRLRVKVSEGVTELVLIDGGGGDGTIGDFAE
jgi:hypothetical protein